MSELVTAIRTATGDKQIDYNALANKPTAKSLGAALSAHKHGISDITNLNSALDNISPAIVSGTAPSNTKALWIDTANSGVLKYHNGSSWVPVGAVWK